jgi:prolipoprotein diacylglyceryltransferase
MAVVITQQPSTQPRAWSIGPYKMEVYSFSIASGDTSVAVTSGSMTSIAFAMISGVSHTAESISGNTVTWTVVDPAASRLGDVILLGA